MNYLMPDDLATFTPIDWLKQETVYCITCNGTADVFQPLYEQCGVTFTREWKAGEEWLVLCPGNNPNKVKKVSNNKVEHV